jgi:hypothetical protein
MAYAPSDARKATPMIKLCTAAIPRCIPTDPTPRIRARAGGGRRRAAGVTMHSKISVAIASARTSRGRRTR